MADWDPFQLEEAGSKASTEATLDTNGTQSLSKADLDLVADTVFKEACTQKPWQRTPDPRPDISWYTPSCSIDNWTHKQVKMETGQGIAYVTFNRPDQGNAMNKAVMLGLCDAVCLLHARKDIRCVIFSGEGKMFCGGTDSKFDGDFLSHTLTPKAEKVLSQLKERAIRAGALEDMSSNIGLLLQAKLWEAMTQMPQFTITLVNGSTVGDGIGLLACVDMVISVKHAYFSISQVRDGGIPAVLAPHIAKKLGPSYTKCMIGSGRNFSAKELQHLGLVSEVVDSVEIGHKTIAEICEVLTACGPRSVEAAKMLVVGVGGQPISEGVMFFTASLLAMVTVSDECKVGMVAVQSRGAKPWEEKPITPLR